MSEETKAGEKRFKYELDNVLGTIADDLVKVNSGELEGLKILSLDERIYARVMNLLKTVEEPMVKATTKKAEETEIPIKKLNIQDAVLGKVAKK